MNKQILQAGGITVFMAAFIYGIIEYINIGSIDSLVALANVFNGLGWFIGSFLLATIFTAYLVVIAHTKFLFRFLAIPTWLFFSVALIVTVDQFLGYAYPSLPPPGKVLAYRVILHNDGEKDIEAWFLSKENRSRLYNFPYDLEKEKALRKALQAQDGGFNIEVDLRGDKSNGSNRNPRAEDMLQFMEGDELPLKQYEKDTRAVGVQSSNEQLDNDDIVIKVPGNPDIRIPAGRSFKVSPEGEIEFTGRIMKQRDPEKETQQQEDDYHGY